MLIRKFAAIFFSLIFAASCFQTRPEQARFPYEPYNTVGSQNRALYNFVFNTIRDRLIIYVRDDLVSHPELIGIIMDYAAPQNLESELR